MAKNFDVKALLQADVKTLLSRNKTKAPSVARKSKVPPLKKEVVVCDIGAKNTKILVGKCQKESLEIYKCLCIETPQDVISDGKVTNEVVLGNTIVHTLKKHQIKTKDVILTTNSTQIINRELIIDAVLEEELETVIRFEMQKYLPINLNDYLIRYMMLDEFEEHDEPKLKVYAIAYPQALARTYYQMLKLAELKPYALETTYFSLNKLLTRSQSLNHKPYNPDSVIAFLDMGSLTIDVNIYKQNKIELTRMIKSGGLQLDAMLVNAHQLSMKEAMLLKNKLDLNDSEESLELATLKLGLNQIAYEIDRIFQFYKNKNYSNIDAVYLFGGLSQLSGIEHYLSEKLGTTVEVLSQIDHITFKNPDDEKSLNVYVNALGALTRL